MSRVLNRIADFLGFISDRQLRIEREQHRQAGVTADMQNSLKTIMAALMAQQGQITQLVAQRDAAEQADLDTIQAAIDANGKMFADALTPSGSAGTTSVTVAAPATAGSDALVVSGAVSSVAVGAGLAGDAVATGTAVTSASPGAQPGTVVVGLSQPTEAAHTGDGSETLTVTAALPPDAGAGAAAAAAAGAGASPTITG